MTRLSNSHNLNADKGKVGCISVGAPLGQVNLTLNKFDMSVLPGDHNHYLQGSNLQLTKHL
jgi:hypothetical protein